MRTSLVFVHFALCATLGECDAGPGDDETLLQVPGVDAARADLSSSRRGSLPSHLGRRSPRGVPSFSWRDAVLQHIEESKAAAKRKQAANKSGDLSNPWDPMMVRAAQHGMALVYNAMREFEDAQMTMVRQLARISPFKENDHPSSEGDDLTLVDGYSCMNMSTAGTAEFDGCVHPLEAVFSNYRQGWDNTYVALFRGADVITDFYEHGEGLRLDNELSYMIQSIFSRERLRAEREVKHEYLREILEDLTSVEFNPTRRVRRHKLRDAYNCSMFFNYTLYSQNREMVEYHAPQMYADASASGAQAALTFTFGPRYYSQMLATISLLGSCSRRTQVLADKQAALLCDRAPRMNRVRVDIEREDKRQQEIRRALLQNAICQEAVDESACDAEAGCVWNSTESSCGGDSPSS